MVSDAIQQIDKVSNDDAGEWVSSLFKGDLRRPWSIAMDRRGQALVAKQATHIDQAVKTIFAESIQQK